MRQALVLAEESGADRGAMRACMNLGYLLSLANRSRDAIGVTKRGIAIARRRGDRVWERSLLTNLIADCFITGEWDEAERAAAELPEEAAITTDPVHASAQLHLATMALFRGEADRAVALAAPFTSWRDSARVHARGVGVWARSLVATADGRHADALAECTAALADKQLVRDPAVVEILAEVGCEAAWTERAGHGLTEILDLVAAAPAEMHESLAALVHLQQARLAVLRDDPEPPFEPAVTDLRRTGDAYRVATALSSSRSGSPTTAPPLRRSRCSRRRARCSSACARRRASSGSSGSNPR
jgi:hypothetical protein